MKNLLIENFFHKKLLETQPQDELTKRIQIPMTQDVLSWEELPIHGQVAIVPHTMLVNGSSSHLHSHNFFEMVYVFSGEATQYLEDGQLTLESGSILLMNMNYHHALSIDSKASMVFNILISRDLLNVSFLSLIHQNKLFSPFFMSSLFSSAKEGAYIYFQKNPSSRVEQLMQSLLEEYILEQQGYEVAIQAYLSLIFTELVRYHIYQVGKENQQEINYSAIMEYISAHLEDVTLNSLSEHFHYTPAYMSAVLRKYLGKSFSSMITELRLNKAAYLLENSDISINVIVEVLGYYDRSYFNRIFKKNYGCSPQEYRDRSK